MLEGKNILPTKILLKKVEKENKVLGSGIIIPNNAEEVSCTGTVVLTGASVDKLDNPPKIGSKVLYPPRAPQRVHMDGEDFYLLNYTDILLFW